MTKISKLPFGEVEPMRQLQMERSENFPRFVAEIETIKRSLSIRALQLCDDEHKFNGGLLRKVRESRYRCFVTCSQILFVFYHGHQKAKMFADSICRVMRLMISCFCCLKRRDSKYRIKIKNITIIIKLIRINAN